MSRGKGERVGGGVVYLAIDKLDILRALRVAIPSAILGTGLVPAERLEPTILEHLAKVHGAVQPARELGDVHVKGEFLVEEVEQLVLVRAGHEVDSGADILAVVVLLDKLEPQGSGGRGGDAVGAAVVGAVDGAVLRAGGSVWAGGCVPLVAGVAVGVPVRDMCPAPVGLVGVS